MPQSRPLYTLYSLLSSSTELVQLNSIDVQNTTQYLARQETVYASTLDNKETVYGPTLL